MSKWAATWGRPVAFALALWSLAAAPVACAADGPAVVKLRVGFDSRYKLGHWTPVEVTFDGATEAITGQVRLILPDGDGVPSVVTASRPVQLLPGRPTAVLLYAKFGRALGDLRVQFQADDKNLVDEIFDNHPRPDGLALPAPLGDQEKLIVTLGASIGAEEAARLHQQSTGVKVAIANLASNDSLPTQWYGYDCADAIVISTGEPDRVRSMLDSDTRRRALDEWVALGGHLLICAGTEAPAVLAADFPLASYAPGKLVEMTTLRRTVDLENFVGGSRKVRAAQGGLSLPVPRLADVQGRIEVADGNLPLVVRSQRRFGQVVFVAVDLDRRPFPDWDGRGNLVARLLGLSEPGTGPGATASNSATTMSGGRRTPDLLDQMCQGLSKFTGVTPISFALVAAMILGYIVLIGPGDYFLVKRLLKRMELTWVTFPLWVVLVSAGAYALATYTKGHELRLNQVDLVDVDVASGWARGTSWLNLFSPQSQTFDLAIEPLAPSGAPVADPQRLLSWLASGDSRFTGGSRGLFAGQYEFAPELDTLRNVPVQVWSTKAFVGRTAYQNTEAPAANMVLAPDGVPAGTIRNTLAIDLSQCMLVSGTWVYLLGDLKQGATARLQPGEQRDLKHVLRHPETWKTSSPLTQHSAEAQKAIQALEDMLFFQAAGEGASHHTTNAQESYIDFSELLDQNRAILVAYAERPAVKLTNAGHALGGAEDMHQTVYRFVYPLTKSKTFTP
ncbi:MAG TPA: hypothetical protein VHD36_08025 [Pirellulales bacterium]|nr:hypothetical protein [Pirellulales bacterium]